MFEDLRELVTAVNLVSLILLGQAPKFCVEGCPLFSSPSVVDPKYHDPHNLHLSFILPAASARHLPKFRPQSCKELTLHGKSLGA